MNNLEFHIKFYDIITQYSNYTIGSSFIELPKDSFKIKKIEELGFKVEFLHSTDRIITDDKFRFFGNINEFFKSNKITLTDNIFIIDSKRKLSFISGKSYVDFVEKDNYHLFTNSISYLAFLKKLKDLEEEIDGSFHFIDSYNRDTRKITLVSLTEKNRLNIIYQNLIPDFDENFDYVIGYEKFIDCFSTDNKNLARFLKNSTINTVINYNSDDRIKLLFENLELIVYKAKVNFEVYLNELSLDKVKKDYDDVKTKYFSNLSEVLSKLTTGILALPLSIAILLFSLEKIKDIEIYLYLLFIIILSTSLFVSSLLRIYYRDLIFTNKLLQQDYNTLTENNFFTKYEEEKATFTAVKDRIYERIIFLKVIIQSYFWILNLSNLFIAGVILYYLGLKNFQIFIPLLLLLVLIILFRNYVLEKDSE